MTEALSLAVKEFTVYSYATKVKEFVIGRGGSYRITWDWNKLWAYGNNYQYCKIYRNGAPVGAEKFILNNGSETYSSCSDDVSGWQPGDLLQLYIYSDYSAGGTGNLKNFRIKSANPIMSICNEPNN